MGRGGRDEEARDRERATLFEGLWRIAIACVRVGHPRVRAPTWPGKSLTKPAGHAGHSDAPISLYRPAAHGLQAVRPEPMLAVPAGQSSHEVRLGPDPTRPTSQARQTAVPGRSAKEPASHALHLLAALLSW